jgi:predicted secreted protein
MAVQAITEAQVALADYDASCVIKSFGVTASAEALDTTAVCTTGWKTHVAGLKSWEFTADGMLDFAAAGQDAKLGVGGTFGGAVTPVSVIDGTALGSLAYFGNALHVDYSILGNVGELAPFSLSAVGKGLPLVRGQVMHSSAAAETATGAATGYQLGAVSATQSIFLGLHVFAISGAPTVAVILESDDNSNFTSATTRITSASYSAATGAEFQRLAGAVTDDYWRVRWTVTGGTDPSVTFLAVVGIATFV